MGDFAPGDVAHAYAVDRVEFGLVVDQRRVGAGFQKDSVRVVVAKIIEAGGLGGGGKVDAGRGWSLRNFATGHGDLVVKVGRPQALEENSILSGLADEELVNADSVDSWRLDAVQVRLIAVEGQKIHGRVAGAPHDFDEACCSAGRGCNDRCIGSPRQTHFRSKNQGTGGDQIFGIGFQIDDDKTGGVGRPCVVDGRLQVRD